MYEASNMKPAKAASSDETWELYQKNIFNNDNLHFFIILREQQNIFFFVDCNQKNETD